MTLGMAQTKSLDTLLSLSLGFRLVHSIESTTRQVIDDSVYQHTPLLDRLDDGSVLLQCLQTGQHVQLTQPPRFGLALEFIELVRVTHAQSANWLQPRVEDTELGVGQRSSDTAAGSVAAHNGVLDFDVSDGVLDDGERRHVGACQNVGDVAVGENVTWLAA